MSDGGNGRRRRLVAANWKMNLLRGEAEAFCRALLPGLAGGAAGSPEVVIFPSFPLLDVVVGALAGSAAVGAQDLHFAARGAHTGDVSAPQVADAGCSWALCGHSERRRDHAESDELVGRKLEAAAGQGLTPLLCIGETLEERRAGHTFEVLGRQLELGLSARPGAFAVAYEPVWAIGTGEAATPEAVEEAHRFVRGCIESLVGGAALARILYGGSVTPQNAASLAARPDVDGFLVGGASLDPERFLAIMHLCGAAT